MNGTTDTADLLSGMFDASDIYLLSGMSDASVFQGETPSVVRQFLDLDERVSDNLGVYFIFCLFGLAILALFLCRSSMQALQTSLFFFVGLLLIELFFVGLLLIEPRWSPFSMP